MFRPVAVALLGFAAIVLGPDAAVAQRKGLVEVSPPHYRHGFWLEGTFGWGEESYKFANDPYNDGLGKPTFGIRLGGTVNPHLRLGFEWTIWVNSYQDVDIDNIPFDVTETLNSFMATARVFPSRNLGLFLKGGAGLGLTYASVDYGNSTSKSALPPTSAPDGKSSSAAKSSSRRGSTGTSIRSRSVTTIRSMSGCSTCPSR